MQVNSTSFSFLSKDHPHLINQLFDKHYQEILSSHHSSNITVYKRDQDKVFSFANFPHSIFKLSLEDSSKTIEKHCHSVVARKLCKKHGFNLLLVARSRLFEVNINQVSYQVLEEEKLDIDRGRGRQEEIFDKQSKNLTQAIKQLTQFIYLTGLFPINWRKILAHHHAVDAYGNRKIVIINPRLTNPEENLFDHIKKALFNEESRGLLRCLNLEQIQWVKTFTKTSFFLPIRELRTDHEFEGEYEYESLEEDFFLAAADRCQEMEWNCHLEAFYQNLQIIKGDEPISIEEISLDIQNPQESQWIYLLLHLINEKLANSSTRSTKNTDV